ncbi:heme biosynthesis HemY N-terminal domain-containing protein [uncultured Deefgea sp.]|uniref:heme biosynthesis HemY N-terminal domain-containing protein n=1 Tax=uncultured Deefgea sp. TaxID=1304914 RepID=UPI00261AED19|nr:heme biosynthesis HemY N-terminal domain-containing protein [uncultured Deefgea sp.]
MRFLIWFIGLFSLAVGLTLFAQVNSGYALIFLPPWRLEISLNIFILLLIGSVIVLYLGLRMLAELGGLPERVRRYRLRQQEIASVQLEREARTAFYEGRFQRSERLASEAFAASPNDAAYAVNGLLAARAAHSMRDYAKRDAYFEQLQARLGEQHLATLMSMAELYLDERRYNEASQAIAAAREINPKLTAAMKIELRLRQRERNPDAVLKLIEQLTRSDALDAEQANHIRIAAYQQQLRQHPMSVRELKDWCRKVPEADRLNPQLAASIATQYQEQGEPALARETLAAAIDAEWNSELLEQYGVLGLRGEALTAQLQQAEQWLKQHPNDHRLLLTLGRLCYQRELWGKAQTYLEASIAVKPTAIAHAELARLLDQLEHTEQANLHYRASLSIALS